MPKILLTDPISAAGLAILRSDPENEVDLLADLKLPLDEVIGGYDAAITRSGGKFNAATLDRAGRMRVIGRAGVGLDNIDVEAASRQGILVINTPTANTVSAVEHTLAMMLALARSVPQADASTRAGGWERKRFVGAELYEKTLGVIGLGRIGAGVAARARAFRMRVVAYDPYLSVASGESQSIQILGLEELLAQSDFVTTHLPLSDETRHLIGAKELALMKPGARLINCARGGIVDEQALHAALAAGKLAGAALDVFETEPPGANPLFALDNVIVTPHLGASTVEAQERVAVQTVEMVLAALAGSIFVSAVNLPFAGAAGGAGQLAPYLDLAERLGAFASQLGARGIESVDIDFWGIDEEMVKIVRVAVLKGLLAGHLGGTVNYVNAALTARQRGIRVSDRVHAEPHDYQNLLQVEVRGAAGACRLAGTLFSGAHPRVTEINGFHLEVKPQGCLLYIVNRDVPGVVGKVGTILGAHSINIAEYTLGRLSGAGKAMAVIAVDSEVGGAALGALAALSEIEEVRLIRLSTAAAGEKGGE